LFAGELRSYEIQQATGPSDREPDQPRATLGQAEVRSIPGIADAPSDDTIRVPQLTGKALREATELCASRGLRLVAIGDGVVARQVPAPGALVRSGGVCQVTLSRTAEGKVKPAAVAVRWPLREGADSN
jgi:hypothetical protein